MRSSSSFIAGLVAGIAVLAVVIVLVGNPAQALTGWVAQGLSTAAREVVSSGQAPVATVRPVRGAVQGSATPTPLPVPPPLGVAVGSAGASDCVAGAHAEPAAVFRVMVVTLDTMFGQPLDCARIDLASGDLQQHTSEGLAYVRADSGTVGFTDGVQHWALSGDVVVFWLGGGPEPPAGAVVIGRAVPAQAEVAIEQPPAEAEVAVEQPPAEAEVAVEQPPAEESQADEERRMRVVGTPGALVLRSAPEPDNWSEQGLLEGEMVTVLESDGGPWARVRGERGLEGWVPTEHLQAPE
jgi:hypothetical protein